MTGRPPGSATEPAGRRGTWRQRLLALALTRFNGRYLTLTEPLRRRLLAGARGRVLEIGPGAGPNLACLPEGVAWIGLEPNPFLHAALLRAAAERGLHAELIRGSAMAIPLPDASVDFVVGTLVLCSVPDVGRALAEIRRVLKPGGHFVFLEHVAAPPGSRLRRVQDLGTPISRCLGDGCHLNRETWRDLERAGFAELRLEHLHLPLLFNAPHVAGTAVNR
jgi:ubiquinone/menaquinone biosynthesis C-methylase UbiE